MCCMSSMVDCTSVWEQQRYLMRCLSRIFALLIVLALSTTDRKVSVVRIIVRRPGHDRLEPLSILDYKTLAIKVPSVPCSIHSSSSISRLTGAGDKTTGLF